MMSSAALKIKFSSSNTIVMASITKGSHFVALITKLKVNNSFKIRSAQTQCVTHWLK